MRFFRCVLSFLLAVSVLIAAVPAQASAVELQSFGDLWFAVTDYFGLVGNCLVAEVADRFVGTSGSLDIAILNSLWYCPAADASADGYRRHIFDGNRLLGTGSCTYCGLGWSEFLQSLKDAEKDYVFDLTGSYSSVLPTCGDQYTETIPLDEHAYTYTEMKAPTCTQYGSGVYSCAVCGGQYTERVEPLGHDWLSTEVVDTSYALPDGTSCPDCDGLDFSCSLNALESVYSCTCNSCGSTWTVNADVTEGYTLYTCSRCGETKIESTGDLGEGLFKSIGNFIADGIKWCTEKLKELLEKLTTIIDTFNEYLAVVGNQASSYPSFLGAVINIFPEDLMAIIWFGVIVFIVLAVIKIWLR